MEIVRIHRQPQTELSKVVGASRPQSTVFGVAERGQEHRRQNRDDGDDDEEFNQSEAAARPKGGVLRKRPWLWELCLQVTPPAEGVTFRDIRGNGVRVGFHCTLHCSLLDYLLR